MLYIKYMLYIDTYIHKMLIALGANIAKCHGRPWLVFAVQDTVTPVTIKVLSCICPQQHS